VVGFAAVTEPKDISRQSESSLRGFWSLFVTQFQGAFSDNVLKNLVVFMLVARFLCSCFRPNPWCAPFFGW